MISRPLFRHPLVTASLLGGFMLLTLLLRLHAISPYLLYPDTYQSLLVAHNLATAHQAVAPLGSGGYTFPPTFDWTRPGYPALILLAYALGLTWVTAAHAVALLAGLIGVLLAYALVSTVLRDRLAGLAATLLLTLSYNATIWGGLGLTEPLANAVLLAALAATWRWRSSPEAGLGEWRDLLTGALWGAAALVRYEYGLLLLPALIVASRPVRWSRLLTLVAGAAATTALGLAAARPLSLLGPGALSTAVAAFIPLIIATLGLVALGLWLARRWWPILQVSSWLRRLLLAGPVLAVLIIAVVPAPVFEGARAFIIADPLLVLAALTGTVILSRTAPGLTLYLVANTVLLAAVYLRVNPAMSRYGTHLIPFLLIPAGAGLAWLGRRLRATPLLPRLLLGLPLGLLILGQTAVTAIGLRAAPDQLWFRPGYEAVAAQRLAPLVPPHAVLVTSLPEPYYFYTGRPTQSIADQTPYLFADLPSGTPLVIVQDEPMRQLFPGFSAFLDTRLQSYRTTQFTVTEPFRYRTEVTPHPGPIVLYQLTAGQFQALFPQ